MPGKREYTGPTERDLEVADACLQQAEDLVASAERLLESNQPHIAYHLAVAALEEIGKKEIVAINSVSRGLDEPELMSAKQLMDHRGKLFWAFFFPPLTADRVDQGKLDQMRGLAGVLHETRKEALYVDVECEPFRSPRSVVSDAMARDMVSMARARIDMVRAEVPREPNPSSRELGRWLLDASSDEHFRRFMFGEEGLAKLRELGDWHGWVAWLREQQATWRAELAAMLDADQCRALVAPAGTRPRWQMRLRLAGLSHKLKPGVLSEWNGRISTIQFEAAGPTNDRSLDVILTVPDSVPLDGLYLAARDTADRVVVALNVATRGLFWWERPQHTARFYEKLVDLETNREVVLSETPRLEVDWGGASLSAADLDSFAEVLVAIPTRFGGNAYEPFAWYLDGISFLAAINVHRRHESYAFACFYESFWLCRERLGCEQRERTLESFTNGLPEGLAGDERVLAMYAIGTGLTAPDAARPTVTLEDVAFMKVMVDWHIARWAIAQGRADTGRGRGSSRRDTAGDEPAQSSP